MKKCSVILLFISLCLVLFSCSQIDSDTPETAVEVPADIAACHAMLGTVNKVYGSSDSSRYYTGQILQDMWGHDEVRFTAFLVEYNCLKEQIVSYIENLPENNALSHQSYAVQYKNDKMYAEFATYIDTQTLEIVANEVRIFPGSYAATFENNYWYAKSITFDPSMQIDLNNNINIYTGQPVNASGGNGGNQQDERYILTEDYPEILETYGTLSKVYVLQDEDGGILPELTDI